MEWVFESSYKIPVLSEVEVSSKTTTMVSVSSTPKCYHGLELFFDFPDFLRKIISAYGAQEYSPGYNNIDNEPHKYRFHPILQFPHQQFCDKYG